MERKAISLISGGLDSVISTKLILEQGIEVIGLHFTSFFHGRHEKTRDLMAKKSAAELGIKLIIKEMDEDYMDVIFNPSYGYGKNMNPCIDCRIYMLKKSKDIMEEEGASFLITGEVLGQRPMSQRRDAINLIEKRSGLRGLILRPLSAKFFPPTIPEQKGIVDRSKLLDITGRSRIVQFELAKKFNLKEYALPGGGCLLTDPIFSKKLKDLIIHDKSITMDDLELLTIGRHFRINHNTKIIVGRNKSENERLLKFLEKGYIFLAPQDFVGPLALIKGDEDTSIIEIAANIIGHYGKVDREKITIKLNNKDSIEFTLKANLTDFLDQYRI